MLPLWSLTTLEKAKKQAHSKEPLAWLKFEIPQILAKVLWFKQLDFPWT